MKRPKLNLISICLLMIGLVVPSTRGGELEKNKSSNNPTITGAAQAAPILTADKTADQPMTLKPVPVLTSDDTIGGQELNVAIYSADIPEDSVAVSYSSFIGKTYAPASEAINSAFIGKHAAEIADATAKWSAELKLAPTAFKVKVLMRTATVADAVQAAPTKNTSG